MTSVSTHNMFKDLLEPRSQRFVVVLALLMIGIVAFQVLYRPGGPAMCDLLENYNIESADRNRIILALNAEGLNQYEVRGDRVFVPKMELGRYLTVIADQKILPQLFGNATDSQISLSPFMPRSQQKILEAERKRRYITEMVVRLPFVSDAWFEMDQQESTNPFGNPSNSAVIVVQPTKNRPLTVPQVATVRELITGAFARLSSEDVVVTDLSVGIAYHENRTEQQARNIAKVQWRLGRQRFYEKEINRALFEFEGIEIEVNVDSPGESHKQPRRNRTADVEGFRRLPRRMPQSLEIEPPNVGANGTASVDVLVRDSRVVTANYETVVAQSNSASMPVLPNPAKKRAIVDGELESNQTEQVSVVIRIPESSILSAYQKLKTEEAVATTATEIFDDLKSEIIAKICPILPEASFASGFPIAVLMSGKGTLPELHPPSTLLPGSIQQLWPLIAVVMVGLLAAAMFRLKDRSRVQTVANEIEQPEEVENQALRDELSQLIDKDPETAARVIKKWIRQAT